MLVEPLGRGHIDTTVGYCRVYPTAEGAVVGTVVHQTEQLVAVVVDVHLKASAALLAPGCTVG